MSDLDSRVQADVPLTGGPDDARHIAGAAANAGQKIALPNTPDVEQLRAGLFGKAD
jgi:hypothetical protein